MGLRKISDLPEADTGVSAMQAANRAAKKSADVEKSQNLKTISIRINETDYTELDAFFAKRATSMAAAGRAALIYIKGEIEDGNIDISHGIITKKHRGGVV